jgi:hypothetical protein
MAEGISGDQRDEPGAEKTDKRKVAKRAQKSQTLIGEVARQP